MSNFQVLKRFFGDDYKYKRFYKRLSFCYYRKNRRTLDYLEYLTQIIVNEELNSKLKVNLDCENYRR
ncbi:MAG: hypothetical protein LBD56_02325, partial [Endomicrobium sp.]|nr:hypothetical protein [Endomicrobium sp.]